MLNLNHFSCKIPWLVIELYRNLGYCVLGAATTFVMTDMSKLTIGRLRPHFLTLCDPVLSDDLCKEKVEGDEESRYMKFVVEKNISRLCQTMNPDQTNKFELGLDIIEKVNTKDRLQCRHDNIALVFSRVFMKLSYPSCRVTHPSASSVPHI